MSRRLRGRRPDRDGFGAIWTAANEDFFILALGHVTRITLFRLRRAPSFR